MVTALPHFRGKSKTFIKRADVILEVEGVGFLAHTDVLLMQCGTVFEGLCREFLQEGADGEAGPSNGGRKRQRGTGTSARAQLPTLVLSSKQPGTRATARSKAPGPSIITPKSFQLFLNHLYDWDAEIASEEDAIDLLAVADFFGADALKIACDQTLSKMAVYRQPGPFYSRGAPPKVEHVELASRYRLPQLMAKVATSLAAWMHHQDKIQAMDSTVRDVMLGRLCEFCSLLPESDFATAVAEDLISKKWHQG
ncbi:hypothetical protein CHLNCDRAFT_133370 [Chlorella variabilis]|uniref:BTB domain-containing protein n=1 Tax=Chlorella variabilis TaxID=554065 RepID=E1Z2Y6_CHLVA|nr:hypothetical protein CHLNCDRAFT_133370 [Chlorella variabilis]EFN60076.1 hypothetical protein CHLNCDRAFT_133370 [Chlorella variabilis]|eukprot:XP_005852178.1 hypothetical protein CHLNCDRAFT_133370 [Chlorella variabilis]